MSDRLGAGQIIRDKDARIAELTARLTESTRALDFWARTYAADMCKPEHVQDASKAIWDAGGTLAFIADQVSRNRAALAAVGGEA